MTPLVGGLRATAHTQATPSSGSFSITVKKAFRSKGHRPQRVGPAPARHELQIPVHQPVTDELARRLGVSRETIRRLAIAGALPHTVVCHGAGRRPAATCGGSLRSSRPAAWR